MAKSKLVGDMMKGADKAFPGSLPPFDGQDPKKPGYSSNPGEKLYGNPHGPMPGEEEGHETAVQLLDNALGDLGRLAGFVPEVDRLVQRLEALRPKAEAADEGEGQEMAAEEQIGAPEVAQRGGL